MGFNYNSRSLQNNMIGSFVRLEQLLMTNGYSKEDLIIVSVPTADQVSVMISSASLIAESNYYQDAGRKMSVGDSSLRKISTSSIEKKVSFDREISIQEEEPVKEDTLPEENGKIDAKEEVITVPVNTIEVNTDNNSDDK